MEDLFDKTNDELIQILKEGTNLHSEERIMDVEVVLQQRDVQYTIPYKKEKNQTENTVEFQPTMAEERSLVFTPILSAAIIILAPLIISMYYTLPRGADPEHLFYLNIGFIVLKRIIVLSLIDHYNKKNQITGVLWYLLGIVFGAWSLVAYNIFLWIRPTRKMDNQILDSSEELRE